MAATSSWSSAIAMTEWRDVWKQYFATRRIGRIAIVPSWESDAHTPPPDEITLQLDPGRAFKDGRTRIDAPVSAAARPAG